MDRQEASSPARPANGLIDRHMSRRLMMAAVAILGGGAVKSAHAFTIEPGPEFIEPPARAGIVSWRDLSLADFTGDGALRLSPAIEALVGQKAVVEGYPLSAELGGKRQFLLGAIPAHCTLCIPGGLASIVEVQALEDVPHSVGRTVTVSGRFDVRASGDGELPFYVLREAQIA